MQTSYMYTSESSLKTYVAICLINKSAQFPCISYYDGILNSEALSMHFKFMLYSNHSKNRTDFNHIGMLASYTILIETNKSIVRKIVSYNTTTIKFYSNSIN